MKIRVVALVWGAGAILLTAGCAAAIAGQAEVDPAQVAANSTRASDDSVVPRGTSGSTAACNEALLAISAFSSVLNDASGSTTDGTISQATVDKALKQLPTSGLPAQPQADVNILRAIVSKAAGKTVRELGPALTDGTVIGAIQDLGTWASKNC